MKLPKELKRYCLHCKKHTDQLVSVAKQRSRSATHPLSRGSQPREYLRGVRGGFGNQGKRSKKGAKDWKRKTKTTKRITVLYTCKTCKKAKGSKSAIRSSRIEIGEKVSK
ncbi:50S ribosomal protein L44e [Candidatus Pacearchaeota archaeon]|nr:50S ribosomal protein L44e [Candidatus Pacearchaeota archaeon]